MANKAPPAPPTGPSQSQRRPRRRGPRDVWTRLLEETDSAIYVVVGIAFLVAAILSLLFAIANLSITISTLTQKGLGAASIGALANSIISFVSDLLLTLIILEVMSTVVNYLRTRATSLKPFLFIGIISATRGILAVGARLSISGQITIVDTEFRNDMIELVVNAAIVIALGVTLRLLDGVADQHRQDTASQDDLDTFVE